MIRIYVLKVPEFLPLVESARAMPHCTIDESDAEYSVISSDEELVFNRKAMGMKPAVWYGAFTGGLDGDIVEFGRDEVRLAPLESSAAR